MFYFKFKRLSSRYIYKVKTSIQSSGGGMVAEKELNTELYMMSTRKNNIYFFQKQSYYLFLKEM